VRKYSQPDAVFRRAAEAFGDRLRARGTISDIASSAQPFIAALLCRQVPEKRCWLVAPEVRAQESLAAELAAWEPGARLFPELEVPEGGEALPDPEIVAERLDLLRSLAGGGFRGTIVVHAGQWDREVPSAQSLGASALRLERGARLDFQEAAARLTGAGYERTPQVASRGQFAIRGGIMDVYSWQAPLPIRIELDDDRIDSLRPFDPDSQISTGHVESFEILAGHLDQRLCPLSDYVRREDLVIAVGDTGEDIPAAFRISDVPGEGTGLLACHPQPFGDLGAGDLVLNAVQRERFFHQLRDWQSAGWSVALAAASDGEAERFQELAAEEHFDVSTLDFLHVPAARGFVFPVAKLAVLSDAELFGRAAALRARRIALRRERVLSGRAAVDFTEFEPGDYVVHLEHGIGRFVGLEQPEGAEVLVLEYANSARLYVPLDQAWQVARYVGLGKRNPDLSELGSERWAKARQKAQKSIFDYATQMLRVQAERDTHPGYVFGPDTHWQKEFEDAFPYDETNDQLRAIAESKADMESPRPMDRLICGDVGFGKTEVAIRAVFKAVMGGKQAAVMAPTTVLAQQHYQNFRERMSEYPITVELLSRYRTPGEQRRVLHGLAEGSVDVVVGTHRLASPDVRFKDLGVVVVDEEQRFGVKHKELLKERFRQIDVLTLSATPIPRTLYLSLMGARDMSLIETPPPNRQPVETIVCAYDERVFRDAIKRELGRGGQVYFLHNRVKTIERVAARITELCPEARTVVGHGQMTDSELEAVMRTFVSGEADVLVSTTIIESGLDIPNANTIIIDRADLFGLADLYQLRGRVGRSQAKAYAYLMLPRDLMGAARKRVSAIKQYSDLGSGFRIAMRDLEIRGAGNLLGTAQSGHIITVGFDLYCKLLRHAVEVLKGGKSSPRVPPGVRLDFMVTEEALWAADPKKAGAFIPASYVADSRTRISCYRRLAESRDTAALDALRLEWRDRFGAVPAPAENALLIARIRLEAASRRVTMVESRDGRLMLTRRRELLQESGRFPRLTSSDPDSRLREVLSLLEKVS